MVNAGFDLSFKLSRVYSDVESRTFGLDQLQHVIQPYMDFQYVEDFGYGSRRLLQFDRLLPSTQLQPIDFPQFTSIDGIDENTAVRVGVRNRFQTKRDALTFDWLDLDTFFQANIVQPDQSATFANTNSTFSNLFNQLTFRPLPWATLTVDSQLPAFNPHTGFTEVDSALDFQATSNLDLTISHRYLDHNQFFQNSSLASLQRVLPARRQLGGGLLRTLRICPAPVAGAELYPLPRSERLRGVGRRDGAQQQRP